MKKSTIILLFILIVLLMSCAPGYDKPTLSSIDNTGLVYEIYYIEKMPCIIIGKAHRGAIDPSYTSGVSCDWTKWEGE